MWSSFFFDICSTSKSNSQIEGSRWHPLLLEKKVFLPFRHLWCHLRNENNTHKHTYIYIYSICLGTVSQELALSSRKGQHWKNGPLARTHVFCWRAHVAVSFFCCFAAWLSLSDWNEGTHVTWRKSWLKGCMWSLWRGTLTTLWYWGSD